MSREVISSVIRGAKSFVDEAEGKLKEAIEAKGEDQSIEFPNTAFHLPMVYSLMGLEITKLGQLKQVTSHSRGLLREVPTDSLWLPYLGDGLDARSADGRSRRLNSLSLFAAGCLTICPWKKCVRRAGGQEQPNAYRK